MSTPPPMPLTYPASPAHNPAVIVLTVLMWVAWLGITVVADFMAFMMFAFADSPGAGNAAKLMIIPTFLWFAFTFVAGAALLVWRGPLQIMAAFLLAISPPFMVFAGYNVLM